MMKESEVQKHFLALQVKDKPGDNALIDISKLRIANGYNPNSLQEIDSFTMCFSIGEIMSAIIDANLVGEKYQNGILVIVDNQKHNPLAVITKNYYNDFDLFRFFSENSSDKNLMNTIANKYGAIVADIPLFKLFKDATLSKKAEMIYTLPYLEQRKLMMYIININNSKLKEKTDSEMVRDKKVEYIHEDAA